MELRQLRYFVTLAEELHFGRAAAREHIVQSALSQQIQRLERELGVSLVERNTHRVLLTHTGRAFVVQARVAIRAVETAAVTARQASTEAAVLRVAVGDASLDSMPQVLRNVRYNHPYLVVHRSEAPVPAQYRMLAERSLDVGFGRAAHVPAGIATEVFRLDPLGVLVADGHELPGRSQLKLADLAGETFVLAEDGWAPEFNEFFVDACGTSGFRPKRWEGSIQSIRAAANVVLQEEGCLAPVTRSSDLRVQGVKWYPLHPVHLYPVSLMWRADDTSTAVQEIRSSARLLAAKLHWLEVAEHDAAWSDDTR